MNQTQKGFTLIELLVVIGILGLLAATLLPAVFSSKLTAAIAADQAQLKRHYQWIFTYQQRFHTYPREGGHKFVLDTWCKGIAEHTEANLGFYFNNWTRGNGGRYQDLMDQVRRDGIDRIWPDLRSVTSEDTDYAGRGTKDRNNMDSGRVAWMVNDNENGWSFADGSLNVLYGDGSVVPLNYQIDLVERFHVGPFDVNGPPFQSWGPNSPHPDLQALDR